MPKKIDKTAPCYIEREEIVAYKKFTLTSPEKSFIRAYVKYKKAICGNVKLVEILTAFEWSDPMRTRYFPAYRDWAVDDQRFCGCFDMVVEAIGEYVKTCQTGK